MEKVHLNIKYLLEDLAYNDSEYALKSIYLLYCGNITRYIQLFIKSKEVTEELLSDVFLSVWENRKLLPQVANFNAYIYKIAKFKSLNYLRDNKSYEVDIDISTIDLFTAIKTTVEDQYISNEIVDKLNAAIEELPPKCKLAFKLVREDKMKYKEAAEHLGISIKTLEIHLTTAVKKIKARLENINLR